MIFSRHKGRLLAAFGLLAAFLITGGAYIDSIPAEAPASLSSSFVPEQRFRSSVTEPLDGAAVRRSPGRGVASAPAKAAAALSSLTAQAAQSAAVSLSSDAAETAASLAIETALNRLAVNAAAPDHMVYYEPGHFPQGENGVLVTADGQELRYSEIIPVSATAYTTERQLNKITATGTIAHVGGIAVDPKVIPYGTKMYIVSEAGAWVYGHAVAEDCGGGIKGHKVDLFLDTHAECIRFGVRNALIYVIEE